jgi:arabinofuranosyltransferase
MVIEMERRTRFFYLGVCLALVAVYILHCLVVNYVVDDSFITFRYVRNFVRGDGLVYNPAERVEGYTNFLWTILLSGFLWTKPDLNLLPVAQFLGIFFGAATIVLVINFSWWIRGKVGLSGLIAGAFLALNSAFVAWSTGGLETTFFAFLVFAGSYAYLSSLEADKKFFTAPILFALSALTRPEGTLFFAVTAIHLMERELRKSGKFVSSRILFFVLIFAAITAPYYLWRLNYYGYPFPNTFYTKVGSGIDQYFRGLSYLWNFVKSFGFVLLVFPPIMLLLKQERKTWINFFFLQVGVYLAYVVYVGGDGLAFFRFFVPILAFAYLLVQEGLICFYDWVKQLSLYKGKRLVPVTAALLLVLSFVQTGKPAMSVVLFPDSYRWREPQSEVSFPGNGDHSYVWFDNYFVDRLAKAAAWLDANAAPGSVVASTPAGAIGYYMDLDVIDMLGLNDVHIAHTKSTAMGRDRAGHEKGDGKYVLSRSPDYILLGNVAVLPRQLDEEDMAKKLVRKSEREIWADPDFHKRYERVTVHLSDEGVFRYFTFYKKKTDV